MKYILGSGVVGCLARKILGDDYQIIPFKRSRYFHFDTPWADNYIKYDESVDDFMRSIMVAQMPVIFYKSPFSFRGQLIYNDHPDIINMYLSKIYGEDTPTIASKIIKSTFSVYPVTVKQLYDSLQNKYMSHIKQQLQLGQLVNIDSSDRVMTLRNSSNGQETKLPYDMIISTIPLDALCGLCGIECSYDAKDNIGYVIRTSAVDLEGAHQCFVADPEILFYKVVQVNNYNYIFNTLEVIEKPFEYFGAYLKYNIDVVEAMKIDKAVPTGDPPDLSRFVGSNIYCVGSNAQWDDMMDVSSCIKRLISLASDNNI